MGWVSSISFYISQNVIDQAPVQVGEEIPLTLPFEESCQRVSFYLYCHLTM